MKIPDNWLVRGAQSAVFYYISCGPCLTISSARKRRKARVRDRKEKEESVARRPEVYAHPGPAELNQYWLEDIDLGPFPPRKRQRKGTRDSQGKPTGKQASLASLDSARDGAVLPDMVEKSVGGVGKRRYRRRDEEYERIIEEDSSKTQTRPKIGADYRMLRAPPINDLHPAIVSMIPLKPEDRRWMREPPPSTDFLNGMIGVSVVEKTTTMNWTTAPLADQAHSSNSKSLTSTDSLQGGHDGTNTVAAVSSNVNRVKKSSYDRLNTPISRPDSAVSTGRRFRQRPVSSRLHHDYSSTASSDGDDDDDGHLSITRPRPVYHAERRPSRRASKRSHIIGVADQDFASHSTRTSTHTPQFSPKLRPQSTNSENMSLRASPRSAASMASPFSSEDEGLPSPRIRPIKTKAHPSTAIATLPENVIMSRVQRPPLAKDHQQSTPRPFHFLRPSKSHTETDVYSTPGTEDLAEIIAGLRLREANSSIDIGQVDISTMLEWKQLSEKAAKEQMWLGPPPIKSETGMMEKRHSVDF
jgi:hypothetical protein